MDIYAEGQTDGWMDIYTDRQIDRQTDRRMDGLMDRHTDRQTDRQIDGHTYVRDRQTDRWMNGQTDKQAGRQTLAKTNVHLKDLVLLASSQSSLHLVSFLVTLHIRQNYIETEIRMELLNQQIVTFNFRLDSASGSIQPTELFNLLKTDASVS